MGFNIGKTVSSAVRNVSRSVSSTTRNVSKSVSSATRTVGSSFSNATRNASRSFSNATRNASRSFSSTTRRVESSFKSVSSRVNSAFSSTTRNVSRSVSSTSRRVGGSVNSFSNRVGNSFSSTTRNVSSSVRSVTRRASNVFSPSTVRATTSTALKSVGSSLRSGARTASQRYNNLITGSYRDAKALQRSSNPVLRTVGNYSVGVRNGISSLNRTVDRAGQFWKGVGGPVGTIGQGLVSLGKGFTAPLRAVDHTATRAQRNSALRETGVTLATGALGKVAGPALKVLGRTPLGQLTTRSLGRVGQTQVGRQLSRLPRVASWLNQAPVRALGKSNAGRQLLSREATVRHSLRALNNLGRTSGAVRLPPPAARPSVGNRKLGVVPSRPRVQVSPVPTIANKVSPTRLVPAPAGNPKWYGVRNDKGGVVWVSKDPVTMQEVARLAKDVRSNGTVRILSGTHGTELGALAKERRFYLEDIDTVTGDGRNGMGVRNVFEMSEKASSRYVNSPNQNILGWCYSERNTSLPGMLNAGQPK